MRTRIGNLLAIIAMPTLWASPTHAQLACSACGPGNHWVDTCGSGSDTMTTSAIVGIDTNVDGWPDTSVVLTGPVTVGRSAPRDQSVNYSPLGAGDSNHPDIIDTEILSMNLTGGGITLQAGSAAGMSISATCSTTGIGQVPRSCGVIQESPGTPARFASSFFEVYFRVSIGGGPFLYNNQAVEVAATIRCVPPDAEYIKTFGSIPLYDTPVGVPVGIHVANLTWAIHDTFPAPVGDIWALMRTAYSNVPDEQATPVTGGNHDVANPEQVLATSITPPDLPGAPDPADLVDFGGEGEVDALAGQSDLGFWAVVSNSTDLVFSLGGENPGRQVLWREPTVPPPQPPPPAGPIPTARPAWAHFHFNNPDGPGDLDEVDALDFWPAGYPIGGVAVHYSLVGEPGGISVLADPGALPILTRAQAYAAVDFLGFTGAEGDVDVDALMVDAGGAYLFSIRPAANFDGGEIILLRASGAASFLNHGGHLWNTAHNVGTRCGLPELAPPLDYNVDAIEAWPVFPELFGGCCFGEDRCTLETEEGCRMAGGEYRGDGSTCGPAGECIPALSDWGLVVMALLALTAGTIVVMRRRAAVA